MTQIRVLVQNTGGQVWGVNGEGGGSIAPLCLSIHNKKPDIIVLTKTRVEDEAFDGKNKWRGPPISPNSPNTPPAPYYDRCPNIQGSCVIATSTIMYCIMQH